MTDGVNEDVKGSLEPGIYSTRIPPQTKEEISRTLVEWLNEHGLTDQFKDLAVGI